MATILAFVFSCIGCIFGIVGIIKASNANDLYRDGFYEMGDQANNLAKIMTIIAFALAGIGGISYAAMFGFAAFPWSILG